MTVGDHTRIADHHDLIPLTRHSGTVMFARHSGLEVLLSGIVSPVRSDRAIAVWLFVLVAMVAAMILVGGVTRLTGSGLSMVEWRPLIGWLPPLSQEQWAHVYGLYQKSPEFLFLNSWMSIDDFRRIFWWEYVHRLWGRLIGLAFVVPFLWFLLRRMVPGRLRRCLVALFILGTIQGGIGWWMVQSGLVGTPAVSHYRLAVHLVLAFAILGLLFWTGLDLVGSHAAWTVPPALYRLAGLALATISLTIITGALVAGLDAGLIHNTFPLMSGHIVPPDYLSERPFWSNTLENPVAVQLHHRILALLTVLAVSSLWCCVVRSALPTAARLPVDFLMVAVLVQAVLGIATLLAAVPIDLAAAHQAGAVSTFLIAVWLFHAWRSARPDDRSSPGICLGNVTLGPE